MDPTSVLSEIVDITERSAELLRQAVEHVRRPVLTTQDAQRLAEESTRLRARQAELLPRLQAAPCRKEDVADPVVFALLWQRWLESKAALCETENEFRMLMLAEGAR